MGSVCMPGGLVLTYQDNFAFSSLLICLDTHIIAASFTNRPSRAQAAPYQHFSYVMILPTVLQGTPLNCAVLLHFYPLEFEATGRKCILVKHMKP